MKLLFRLFTFFILIAALGIIGILGYMGFIPGLSSLMGTDKPRDLGISYSEADRTQAREKSQIEYVELPGDVSPESDWQTSGTREVATQWTSAEVSALMNNRPWKSWPYENVQIRFNGDGSAEVSGTLIKSRLPGYGARLGIPKEAMTFLETYLPQDPVFYLKGKAALKDNALSVFQPQSLEIGRVPIPLDMVLSWAPPTLVREALAVDIAGMAQELSKVTNKQSLIMGYINERLGMVEGFYARSAYFTDNALVFDGTLPEREANAR